MFHPRWARYSGPFPFTLTRFVGVEGRRLSPLIDAVTVGLSRLIGATELGVVHTVRFARAVVVTRGASIWEGPLNVAIVLASTLLVLLTIRSIQGISSQLVEFATAVVNDVLARFDLPAL